MKSKPFLLVFSVLVCFCLGVAPVTNAQDEQTYTVKRGDTLSGLAEKFYQNRALWPKLWELNKSRLGNPHQLNVGDVLIIYAKEKVVKAKAPTPPPKPKPLYQRSQPLDTEFPKYFTFLANPKGIAPSGANRIVVEKIDPTTRKLVKTYSEIYWVGEIIASEERGYTRPDAGEIHGRVLLSYYDNVYVSFTENVVKILDSAAHGEPDPYFRQYPIYGLSLKAKEPTDKDQVKELGQLHRFKGVLTVVARVETSRVPLKPGKKEEIKKMERMGLRPKLLHREPVFYLARITSSVLPIEIGDRIFVLKRVK